MTSMTNPTQGIPTRPEQRPHIFGAHAYQYRQGAAVANAEVNLQKMDSVVPDGGAVGKYVKRNRKYQEK